MHTSTNISESVTHKSTLSGFISQSNTRRYENGDTQGQFRVLTSQERDSCENFNKQIEHPECLINKTSDILDILPTDRVCAQV